MQCLVKEIPGSNKSNKATTIFKSWNYSKKTLLIWGVIKPRTLANTLSKHMKLGFVEVNPSSH